MIKNILLMMFIFAVWSINAFAIGENKTKEKINILSDSNEVITLTPTPLIHSTITTTQAPNVTASISPTQSEVENTNLSVKTLAVTTAEREYKLNNSIKNRNILLLNYERLIELVCFKNFYKELNYDSNTASNECKNVIKKTLDIYPFSATAICANVGYKDKRCQEAYKHIIVSNSSIKKDEKDTGISELNDFFKKIDEVKVPQIQDALKKAHLRYSKTKKTADLMAIIALNDKMIRYVCDKIEFSYSNECETCKEEKNDMGKINNIDFFAGIKVEDSEKNLRNKDKENILTKKIDKIIHLSKDCEEFLKSTSNFEPKYPNPICKQKGEYSPDCLNALINWKKYISEKYQNERQVKKNRQVAPQNTEIFESF